VEAKKGSGGAHLFAADEIVVSMGRKVLLRVAQTNVLIDDRCVGVLAGVGMAGSTRIVIAAAAMMLFAGQALAETKTDILRSLNYQKGTISLGDNLASISLNQNFYYLNKTDTQTFLTRVWENPPATAEGVLGMLLPAKLNPLSAEGWAVVIKYDASGYVSDADAEKIDYAELLREMQEAVQRESAERVKQGYEKYDLIGWARQPYYNKSEKKLYWAKRLRFGDSADETLNYEIRALGRKGVLSLNAVAGMTSLAQIDRSAPEILSMVSFNEGNRYSEFNPSVDEAAAYGIAGLIAGGLLTKAGFFKGLIAVLLASKKLGIIAIFGGLAGLWAGMKRIFRGKSA
jgi:uncharacterized membrane-anchored protein